MISGILSISLNPCYVSFAPSPGTSDIPAIVRHLSYEELKQLIVDLGLSSNLRTYPSHELILHLPASLSTAALLRLSGNSLPVARTHSLAS